LRASIQGLSFSGMIAGFFIIAVLLPCGKIRTTDFVEGYYRTLSVVPPFSSRCE
jgi:hypothetical protein